MDLRKTFENKEGDDDSKLAVYEPWMRERLGNAKEDEEEDDDSHNSLYRR